MKVVVAPDSFKECMSAKTVCLIIKKSFEKVLKDVEIKLVPMADGGDGTIDSINMACNLKICYANTKDPLFRDIRSSFAIIEDENTAIIEMARTSGLELIEMEKRNPYLTTTYGTGELIKKALDMKVEKIIIAIGGSATNDAGVGMLNALGVKFLNEKGEDISLGAKYLKDIRRIDIDGLDKRLKNTKIVLAIDVLNPLTGLNGASYIFGKQKGATDEMIKQLDENLEYFANIVKKQFNLDFKDAKGAGAAGGLGFAIMTFLNPEIRKGVDILAKYCKLEEKIKECDLVITAEGSIDKQTKFGKTTDGVLKLAKKYDKKIIAIAANVDIDEDYEFDAVFSIMQKVECLDEAIKNGVKNLEKEAENIAKILKMIGC